MQSLLAHKGMVQFRPIECGGSRGAPLGNVGFSNRPKLVHISFIFLRMKGQRRHHNIYL